MSSSESVLSGRKPVHDAVKSGAVEVDCVYFRRELRSPAIRELQRLCASKGVPIKHVPQAKLDRLTGGTNHQGVAAVVAPVPILGLDEMLTSIAATRDVVEKKRPLLVLPAEINDPHNLGAIIRSAVAFGASGVLLPERGSARLTPTVVKTSAGAVLGISFARIPNVAQAILQLKERGYWVAGLVGDGETSIADVDWDRPFVLAVGGESKGLGRRVEEVCDYRVSIPMSSKIESLNASVAAGIALQAASRLRVGK